jgi:ADP-ribosylglycohydrolase/sugar/nucleoside kinase (ribokinase family)
VTDTGTIDPRSRDRALGALLGLALGDAMGMPTQEASTARAEQLLAAGPALLPGPADNPISPGQAAGTVTDDTAQALVLARLLVEGQGRVDPYRLADALLGWQDEMAAAGSLDLLGPSTKAALQALRDGADPATTGRRGTTNGAAMRIAGVGIAASLTLPACSLPGARTDAVAAVAGAQLDDFMAAVADAGRVSHDTETARAGAAAVGAAISLAVAGVDLAAALPAAVMAARRAGDPVLAERIEAALALAATATTVTAGGGSHTAALRSVADRFGTSPATRESVPAAFAVAALAGGDVVRAAWLGARLGGDSDTIAAMAAAMVGAAAGASAIPSCLVDQLHRANPQLSDLPELAEGLLHLRGGATGSDDLHAGTHLPPTPGLRRLVGVTSILVDVTLAVPQLPARGGDVLARLVSTATGGGLNALVAASRLGLPAAYAGRHGGGRFGDRVRRALAVDGVAALNAPAVGVDSGWCLALVEPDGERTFVTVPGIEAELTADILTGLQLRPGDALYLSGYDLVYPVSGPVLAAWVAGLRRTADGGPWVCLDPGPLAADIDPVLLGRVLPRVDLVTASAGELAALQLGPSAASGGAVTAERSAVGADRLVLERRGDQGAVLHWPGGRLEVTAAEAPGEIVDTNGAGDTHLGALLAALSHGAGWPAALQTAARAAAFSLTRHGAAAGPTRDELDG